MKNQVNQLVNYYKNRIEELASSKIINYFTKLNNKNIVVYSIDIDCAEIIHTISTLDNIKLHKVYKCDSANFIDFSKHTEYLDKQMTIVIIYMGYPVFFEALSLHYQEHNILDIMDNFALDLLILNNDYKDKLWLNIQKLEKLLDQKQIDNILEKKYESYFDLFKDMLIEADFLKEETLLFRFRKDYDYLIQSVDSLLTFVSLKEDIIISKDNKVFYCDYLIREFDNCCILESPLYFSRSKFGFLLEYSFIHEQFNVNSTNEIKKNKFYYEHIKKMSSKEFIKIQAFYENQRSISLGYPKLDRFIKYYHSNNEEAVDIVFMSSVYYGGALRYSASFQDEFFFDDIINEFYSKKIIYRPHPSCLKERITESRIERLKNYKNLTVDYSQSYFNILSKNKVLISEGFGSSVYMYALATLKPVIFYTPNKNYFKVMKGIYADNLSQIGDFAKTKNELFKLINKYLYDKEYIQNKINNIKEFRSNIIHNIGNSKNNIITFFNNYSILVSNNKIKRLYEKTIFQLAKNKVRSYFDSLNNYERIVIYGAGEHFNKILQRIYNFEKLNIYFTDSNQELWGKEINGIPVISKLDLLNTDCIIISSKKYEKEIYDEISLKYNNIITIYNNQEIKNEINTILYNQYQIILFWFNICKIECYLDNNQLENILRQKVTSLSDLSKMCLISSKQKFNFTTSLEKVLNENNLYLIENEYFSKTGNDLW